MKLTSTGFPFLEYGKGGLRRDDGSTDYYDKVIEAEEDGWAVHQIWSVIFDDDIGTYTYGPPHHYVNRIGFVATEEYHDDQTYYYEVMEYSDEEEK